jgi:hypothetical protein
VKQPPDESPHQQAVLALGSLLQLTLQSSQLQLVALQLCQPLLLLAQHQARVRQAAPQAQASAEV